MSSFKTITNVNFYVLDDQLSKKLVYSFTFDSGEIKTIQKYDTDKHYIYFSDGISGDMLILVNRISSYRLIDNNASEKTVKEKPIAKKGTKKQFSLYGLAKGKPGKKFAIKQFLEITKNAKKKPGGSVTDKTLKLDDGYVYEADSQQEISTLKKLISHDAFKRLRGQCINIPYKFGGKNHNYYPDFILLTQTNKIVILEVIEIAQMNTKQNIRKYEALKKYCLKNGYLYIMCDKSFTPFEKLKDKDGSPKVNKAIDEALKTKGYFDYSDYKKLIEGQTHSKVKWYRKAIGIYVASHKKVKMVGDLAFESKRFRIISREKKIINF